MRISKLCGLFAILLGLVALAPAAAAQDNPDTRKGLEAANISDFRNARIFFQAGCDASDLVACYNLALTQQKGEGGAKDTKSAWSNMEKVCASGEASGCYSLATFAKDSVGNYHQFEPMLIKSCELNSAPGCLTLGRLKLGYESAIMVETNEPVGLAALDKACRLNVAQACRDYGWSIKGKNDPLALKYFTAACKGNHKDSCWLTGKMLRDGEGGPVNFEHARQAYQKGCELQSASACMDGSNLIKDGKGGPANPELAKQYMDRANALFEANRTNSPF